MSTDAGTARPIPRRVLLSWSSGKDSAWALHVLRQSPELTVIGLLTTSNEAVGRVAMHGVRRTVLVEQASAAGLPLWEVPLPDPCSNEEYERRMAAVIERAREQDVAAIAFGDLYLEDVRAYRERQMGGTGIEPLFPLWGRPTRQLAEEMLDGGLRALITCVDTEQLDRGFVGRWWDRSLIAELPPNADPCGENGEWHSCAVAGPMFEHPLAVTIGETVDKGRFVFTDVIPAIR